ncbi:MAG: hypothetical protein Q8Q33_06070 [Chlamydiota bacterium]|nr:hypothetical protein [Chlamydiota bacterium]
MDRIVNKSTSFQLAHQWDIEQNVSMTPLERLRIARLLRDRVYTTTAKDVRECHKPL